MVSVVPGRNGGGTGDRSAAKGDGDGWDVGPGGNGTGVRGFASVVGELLYPTRCRPSLRLSKAKTIRRMLASPTRRAANSAQAQSHAAVASRWLHRRRRGQPRNGLSYNEGRARGCRLCTTFGAHRWISVLLAAVVLPASVRARLGERLRASDRGGAIVPARSGRGLSDIVSSRRQPLLGLGPGRATGAPGPRDVELLHAGALAGVRLLLEGAPQGTIGRAAPHQLRRASHQGIGGQAGALLPASSYRARVGLVLIPCRDKRAAAKSAVLQVAPREVAQEVRRPLVDVAHGLSWCRRRTQHTHKPRRRRFTEVFVAGGGDTGRLNDVQSRSAPWHHRRCAPAGVGCA